MWCTFIYCDILNINHLLKVNGTPSFCDVLSWNYYITWHLFSFNLVVSKPITIVWSISYWYESNTFEIDWWFYNFRCIFTVKNCTIWKFSECDYSLIQRHSHTHGNLYPYNEIESNSNAHDFAQLFFFMQSLEWCSNFFIYNFFYSKFTLYPQRSFAKTVLLWHQLGKC